MLLLCAILASGAVAGAVARTGLVAESPPVFAIPDLPLWEQRPSPAEIAWVYPQKARSSNIGGRASMECTAAGKMSDCLIESEDPSGMGFGVAALKSAKDFKMSPRTRAGRSVEGAKIHIPIRFLP